MIKDELEQVIENFEEAIRKNKRVVSFASTHRVEQVLRILKVDLHDFFENENKRSGIHRHLWQEPRAKK